MSALLRIHDGERFCVAIDAGTGRKYRHVVVITDGGVRVIDLPLEQPVEVLGEVKKKHVSTFRRVGKVFGITKAAESAPEGDRMSEKIANTFRWTWKTTEKSDPRSITRIDGGFGPIRQRHHTKVTEAIYIGDFDVVIDVDALAREVVTRAAHNRSGKARLMKGVVSARRISRTKMSESSREVPIPEGYEVVE